MSEKNKEPWQLTNLETAREFVWNAITYAKGGKGAWRLDVVLANLEYIQECLENPDEINQDHTWDDFK
jgi:hypothetical protein